MRIVLLVSLLVVALCGAVGADFLGIKKNTEKIALILKEPLDSAYGIQRKPDSAHVFTYADNATTASYSARSATYPFTDMASSPIDTIKHNGDTVYVLTATISDIDGTAGNFELAIVVYLYTGIYYTQTTGYVQVVEDSLTYDLKQGRDSAGLGAKGIKQANDTLALYDNWVRDSIHNAALLAKTALDTLQLYDNWLRDSIHNAAIYARIAADSIQVYDNAGRFQANAQEILDSIKLYDNWIRDSIHNATIYSRIAADSIQLYDNWLRDSIHNQSVAVLATWTSAARDSILANLADANTRMKVKIAAILDTLQLYDNWLRDSIHNQSVAVLASKTGYSLSAAGVQAVEAGVYAKTFTTADTTLRIKLIDGTGANPDTVLTRTAAGSTPPTAKEVASEVKASLIATDTTHKFQFTTDGDSVRVIDPVRTVAATVSGGATEATVQKAIDTGHVVHAAVNAIPTNPVLVTDTPSLTASIIAGVSGGSCDLTGIIDSARVIDSILRAMSPVLTQARDSILNMWGLIVAKFDTSFVGMGIADTSRSTSTYTTSGDTVHIFKAGREYMTFIRKHPLAYPGARPDSTEAKR